MSTALKVTDVHASFGDLEILKGVDLEVPFGEIHVLMGPNGSGKSTLCHVLMGKDDYAATGSALVGDTEVMGKPVDERARAGLFEAFQYPVEIPGVNNTYFLRAALNAIRKHRDEKELDAMEFLRLARSKAKLLKMDQSLLSRPVNEGFSGGEKKRNEIFQMSILEPTLGILDETDSGLDIDALRIVSEGVNTLRSPERAFMVVTHYQRLLEYIVPDYVHVLDQGRIVKSGDKTLALELEKSGYSWLREEASEAQPVG